MSLGTGRRAALCAALAGVMACLGASSASADPTIPLGHEGRWITDASGRVVILHGVNMVYKGAPYHPAAGGFSDDDAAFLQDNGFNTVRLGLIYKAVEPTPGTYDDAYLDQIAATEQNLAAHGIFSLLDFHQDLYNERFHGEGWPDWAVQDDGLPNQPDFGFPGNYLGMPALNRAFDHWWANDAGPGGVGLQDRYAAAFTHVAQRFAGANHTIGYDLLNEPWPGSVYPSCTGPAGCPAFDMTTLTDFSLKMIAAIRAADAQKLAWYEPLLTFDFGAQTWHGDTNDAQAGFSFHDYCLPAGLGAGSPPGPGCDVEEGLPFQNADRQSQNTGDALLLTEFGATDDLARIGTVISQADQHMVGWQYWHYCGCDDPTTQDATGQAVVNDANLPPTGDNVREEKRDLLSRAYPQVVAGTPESYTYDEAGGTFELDYSTIGPGGEDFSSGARATEVFIPADDYPAGYGVRVDGGTVTSAPGAEILRVVACPGAERVEVRVSPRSTASGPGCASSGESGAGAAGPSTQPPPRPRPRQGGRPRKRKSCRGRHRTSSPRPKRCASRHPSGSRRSSDSGREAAR